MNRQKTPQEKKALSYKKDHVVLAESHAAHFKTYRFVKARAMREERHKVKAIFQAARLDDNDARGDLAVRPIRRKKVRKWAQVLPLERSVPYHLEQRVKLLGWSHHFTGTYDSSKREAFAAFLESLVEGKSEKSAEIAARIYGYLTPGPRPADRIAQWKWHINTIAHKRLAAFFNDEPEWETRLRAWVNDLTGNK